MASGSVRKDASMSNQQWRQFTFFEPSNVNIAEEDSPLKRPSVTSVGSGSDNLFIGEGNGRVSIVSRSLRTVRSFTAFMGAGVTFLKQPRGTSLLLTIGEDLPNDAQLKVWTLDKLDKKTGSPVLACTLTVNNGHKRFPISAFAALNYLNEVAIGFANGTVVLVRGDLIHDRGAKQKTIFESEEPITGLAFREDGKQTTLFVSTTGRLLTYVTTGKGHNQPARILESSGCGVGCMAMKDHTGDVVVARDDAIYFYENHGRGPCYAFDGYKTMLNLHKDYTAFVSPSTTSTRARISDSVKNLVGRDSLDPLQSYKLIILDTKNMLVAYTATFSSSIRAVFSAWNDIFVLTMDGSMHRHQEKDMQRKLDALYQRNLHVLALGLAENAGYTAAQLDPIHRRYGDYLYAKGEYDSAMQQYIKSIDTCEPSHVIRKFLDSQKLQNLTEYLAELLAHGKAEKDHTTLLLSCYTKLKDEDKLRNFIRSGANLKLDLDASIAMCRQGGYFAEAAFLAKKHGKHSVVLEVLVEDLKQNRDALDYLRQLEADELEPHLQKYGRILLEALPDEVTSILIDSYTGNFTPVQPIPQKSAVLPPTATSIIQNYASYLPYINTGTATTAPSGKSVDAAAEAKPSKVPYSIPPARTAFAMFINYPRHFVRFLEACAQRPTINDTEKRDLSTTLFEMYLQQSKQTTDANEKALFEKRAKMIVQREDSEVEACDMLLLSHLKQFRPGTVIINEKSGFKLDTLRSYAAAKDTDGVVKSLGKYGPSEPEMYRLALLYFISSPEIFHQAGPAFAEVLRKIQESHLMAPLELIQILSTNAVATMGFVKEYLNETIERERKEIIKNRRLIESYQKETKTKQEDITRLNDNVFQVSRCNACGGNLDLPVVHFLCKHSFHQRCLNEVDGRLECPICAGDHATIRAIRNRQDETADRHEAFKALLEESDDKFKVIMDYFSRGVMDSVQLEA